MLALSPTPHHAFRPRSASGYPTRAGSPLPGEHASPDRDRRSKDVNREDGWDEWDPWDGWRGRDPPSAARR
ncbi:hypothetical protein GCM10011576_31170 [Micromonospora parathelypteridis]|nr:hypothetical protein GCM10011576_31170 [Micromonospora parathelypteridis]